MTSWYRRFIPAFSEIIELLQKLLRKETEWKWGIQQDQALKKIKEVLTLGPILACPDFDHPFQLESNARRN